jgi:hypothetical protein
MVPHHAGGVWVREATLRDIFGVDKPLIAICHLRGLDGITWNAVDPQRARRTVELFVRAPKSAA